MIRRRLTKALLICLSKRHLHFITLIVQHRGLRVNPIAYFFRNKRVERVSHNAGIRNDIALKTKLLDLTDGDSHILAVTPYDNHICSSAHNIENLTRIVFISRIKRLIHMLHALSINRLTNDIVRLNTIIIRSIHDTQHGRLQIVHCKIRNSSGTYGI